MTFLCGKSGRRSLEGSWALSRRAFPNASRSRESTLLFGRSRRRCGREGARVQFRTPHGTKDRCAVVRLTERQVVFLHQSLRWYNWEALAQDNGKHRAKDGENLPSCRANYETAVPDHGKRQLTRYQETDTGRWQAAHEPFANECCWNSVTSHAIIIACSF